MGSKMEEIKNLYQLNHTETYIEPILSSSYDLSTIMESQIDETTNWHQMNNTKTSLKPKLSSSYKKGINSVQSSTASNASNKKVRLPPSIQKGSTNIKLKRRKKKKNKSVQHTMSHEVSTLRKSVKVFGLVERNESSQELSSEPSFSTNR